jgi:D-tyrosyl-tRNA(Tyr) deacylase
VINHNYLLFAVEDEVISSIGKGLCVLIGISKDDTTTDMEYM